MAIHSFTRFILTSVLLGTLTLLQGQSILTATVNTPGGAGILSEACSGPYELVIRRGVDNTTTTVIFISDVGVAQAGVDYNFPPGSFPVNMLPEDSIVVIPILVVNDGLPEGTESLIWELAYDTGTDFGIINPETSITDAYSVQINSASDTIEWCRDLPYVLLASSDAAIHWSPAEFFDDADGEAATVRPHESGWYYANVGTKACGARDSVYFNLAIVDITNPDTVYICKDGDGVILQGTLDGLATEFNWVPTDSLSDPEVLNPLANPIVTTTYLLKSDIGVCTAFDRVVVRVDSIPSDLHIDIAPFKPYYCAGEIVALFSPSYDSLQFPDLTFNWIPYNATFTSAQDLLNAALILQDTTLYIRENLNNACRNSDSILINVVPSSVPISVSDTTLCPGQSFHVMILSNQVTDPEWTPEEGLSCTKCLNPNVTVIGAPGSSQGYQFSGKILECPVGANLNITIPPIEFINLSADQVVCAGDMIPVTILNPEGLINFNWSIDFGNASLSCTSCTNPTVTINETGTVNVLVSAMPTDPTQYCGAQGFIQLSPGQIENIQLQADQLVCDGDTTSVFVLNPLGLSDYNWTVTEGDASLSCTNCFRPIVTVHSGGQVKISVTASVSDHTVFCSAKGEITLLPGLQAQDNNYQFQACLGDAIEITTDPDYSDFHWEVDKGDLSLSCTNCPNPIVTVHSAGQLKFSATPNSSDTCSVSGLVPISIFNRDASNLLITPDPATGIGQGADVMASLNFSPPPSSVTWTVNGVTIPATTTTISFNASEEINFVTATFLNSKNCTQTDTLSFPTIPPDYKIPNAFTPDNNDELNDNFKIIINGNIVVNDFMIFNRWGQLVYKAEVDDGVGWDGMFKNQPAASDTYVYKATLRFPDGKSKLVKGDVILLR